MNDSQADAKSSSPDNTFSRQDGENEDNSSVSSKNNIIVNRESLESSSEDELEQTEKVYPLYTATSGSGKKDSRKIKKPLLKFQR